MMEDDDLDGARERFRGSAVEGPTPARRNLTTRRRSGIRAGPCCLELILRPVCQHRHIEIQSACRSYAEMSSALELTGPRQPASSGGPDEVDVAVADPDPYTKTLVIEQAASPSGVLRSFSRTSELLHVVGVDLGELLQLDRIVLMVQRRRDGRPAPICGYDRR